MNEMGDDEESILLEQEVEVGFEIDDEVADDERGIALTHGNSTSIQGNLPPSPIRVVNADDNDTTIDADEGLIDALENVGVVVYSLATVIAKRDMEYGDDYMGVKNQAFLDGNRYSGQRPRLQNIPELSRGIAESLGMLRYCDGKKPGGVWNLTYPREDGNPGIARSVPGCKNESFFWDCLAQQVRNFGCFPMIPP